MSTASIIVGLSSTTPSSSFMTRCNADPVTVVMLFDISRNKPDKVINTKTDTDI